MALNLDLATAVWRRLLPGFVHTVEGISLASLKPTWIKIHYGKVIALRLLVLIRTRKQALPSAMPSQTPVERKPLGGYVCNRMVIRLLAKRQIDGRTVPHTYYDIASYSSKKCLRSSCALDIFLVYIVRRLEP